MNTIIHKDGPVSEIVKFMKANCYLSGGFISSSFNDNYKKQHGTLSVIDENYTESMITDVVNNGHPVTSAIYNPFVKHGNLDMIKFLYSKGYDIDSCDIMDISIEYEHSDIIIWAGKRLGGRMNSYWCALACLTGNIELVESMINNGFVVDNRSCSFASYRGHIDLVKWLMERNYPCCKAVFEHACTFGNIQNLEKLYEMGCPWDQETCACASKNGNLEALQWIRSKGCPWDSLVLKFALGNQHYDIFQWAIANGCPED